MSFSSGDYVNRLSISIWYSISICRGIFRGRPLRLGPPLKVKKIDGGTNMVCRRSELGGLIISADVMNIIMAVIGLVGLKRAPECIKMHHFEGENAKFFLGRGSVPPDPTPSTPLAPPFECLRHSTPQTTFLHTDLGARPPQIFFPRTAPESGSTERRSCGPHARKCRLPLQFDKLLQAGKAVK